MENPICQSRARKSVGFIYVNDPADTIAMVTADLAGESKFEDRSKHSGNRFGAPAQHTIDLGCFGPKGVKDACLAFFNFGRGTWCKTCRASLAGLGRVAVACRDRHSTMSSASRTSVAPSRIR